MPNCFRFAPRDSLPSIVAKICRYLKEHPGWSTEELTEEVKKYITEGVAGVASVNGKTGIVTLNLADVLADNSAQVKLCTATEFTANTLKTWNAYYKNGYRVVAVVNDDSTAVDFLYILKQDVDNHQPIMLNVGGGSDPNAYSPTNPPPYPVTSVNEKTGAVTVDEIYIGDKAPSGDQELWINPNENPYIPSGDATTLNGKPGKYYIQPRNELDNSYFVDPVAQLPMNAWHGSGNYAIDRWNLTTGATVSQTADGLKIVSNKTSWTAGIQQRFKAKSLADVMTFAVRGVFPVACRLFVYIGNGTVNFGQAYFRGDAAERTLVMKMTKPDGLTGDELVNLYISPDTDSTGTAAVVRWAALYEGEYTAETLPPYVPKGYAAELAECKRYFQTVLTNMQTFVGYCANGLAYCFIPLERMRVKPTIIATGKFNYNLGNKQGTTTKHATAYSSNENQAVIICEIAETGILTGTITPQGTIYISSEL